MTDLSTSQPHASDSRTQAHPPGRVFAGLDRTGLGRAMGVLGLYVAVAFLYWPSAAALNTIWTDTDKETYTHGYLVLLLSLWLIVRGRARLAAAPAQPAPGALAALAVLSALWLWAWRAALQELHLLLLPLILFTAVVAAVGWRAARAVAFPIGFLYFALPLWGNINGIVRAASSWATGVLIWITGLPAYMAGNYVHLPGGTIEIANSCSGLHALIVGLTLAALYGEVSDESPRRRLEWLAVMGGLSLLVNWARIFIVISAADATDMRSSLVQHHYWLGWWLFAAGFAGFLWWAGRRAATGAATGPRATHPASVAAGARIRWSWTPVVIAVLGILPAASYAMDWARSGTQRALTVEWPAAPAGWRGPFANGATHWAPRFTDPSVAALRVYTDPQGQRIEAFTVAYREQTQNGKLLGYRNTLLGVSPRLHTLATRIVHTPVGTWRDTRVVDSAGVASIIWSQYRIGDRPFLDPRLSQLWYGVQALIRPPVSSLIALRTQCAPDCRAAETRLGLAARYVQPTLR